MAVTATAATPQTHFEVSRTMLFATFYPILDNKGRVGFG
jgi:hypothetical protein